MVTVLVVMLEWEEGLVGDGDEEGGDEKEF